MLKNATIAVPLTSFWQSLEIVLIICIVEMKLRWTKLRVLALAGVDNDAADSNNIFTTKDTKIYVPVVILLAKDNEKLSKLLSKGFKRSFDWN